MFSGTFQVGIKTITDRWINRDDRWINITDVYDGYVDRWLILSPPSSSVEYPHLSTGLLSLQGLQDSGVCWSLTWGQGCGCSDVKVLLLCHYLPAPEGGAGGSEAFSSSRLSFLTWKAAAPHFLSPTERYAIKNYMCTESPSRSLFKN